ncbi:unnamed protein product [Brachionus calyciflorus]|uniref:Intraflagellar transport protein 57 homolog n=1 Tax=Brachionus calyciflorus TaxID=104777 RepID=A0A813XMS6_9BILA|nr:unnamed protein product [Brachionus calyciflorus]
MSDEERNTGKNDSSDIPTERSPGEAYVIFIEMNNLLNKLKLLNYEDEYLIRWKMKPLSRHYFAIQSNTGEQFHSFITLAAWLIQQCGNNFDKPQEFDDPNTVVSGILNQLRKFGYEVNFGVNKVKTGSGEQVIYTLNRLSDEALKNKNFSWKDPEYNNELEEQDDDQNKDEVDEAELDLNKIEENMLKYDDDDDEIEDENILNMEALNKLNTIVNSKNMIPEKRHEEILESNTDATEWKLEVERVLPQLKVTIKTDHKDWRTHIEQMHNYQESIEESLKETKTYFEKLYDEISRTLEKIGSREKYINNQLEEPMQALRNYQDRLAEIKETFRVRYSGVTERSNILNQVTNELQRVKEEMEEAGQSMTDGSPLIKIKKAMENIKLDMKNMDVRIGVLEHILIQAKLRHKDLIHENKDK